MLRRSICCKLRRQQTPDSVSTLFASAQQQVSNRFFDQQRTEMIKNLAENKNDKSIAGKVDAGILDLVNLINSKPDYFTTSSCSGRISLFHRDDANVIAHQNTDDKEEVLSDQQQKTEATTTTTKIRMKRGGGKGFLWSTHDEIQNVDQVVGHIWSLLEIDEEREEGLLSTFCPGGTVELKFEPVILHVRCRHLESAQLLVDAAMTAGLRKTGMLAPNSRLPMNKEEREFLSSMMSLSSPSSTSSANSSSKEDITHVVPNYLTTPQFFVNIGSTAGVNNIICLEGKMILSNPESLYDLLSHFNSELLMKENVKRKQLLFDQISKF